jgi:rfaE bifunctional protein nucleotidyltransferase chain/domain
MTYSKILTPHELLSVIGGFPRKNKTIMCHGCWDIVHPGHIRHLTYAKSKADILMVSLTSDMHITKGIYRPHVPERIRAESLAALEVVDYVIIDDNATPFENIALLKPDYFAKGFEYSDEHHEATVAEINAVEGYGGQMIFTPGDVVYSSTKLLNTHLPKLQIEKLISLMNQFGIAFGGLRDAVGRFGEFKIHVIGDSIVDTYTRTNLIGSNAKTPTFSVLYDGHEDFIGGAGIVAEHLRAAGAEVIFDTGRVTRKNTITCGGVRMLKIDTVDNTPIPLREIETLARKIKETNADCVVFSDFRHGIFHKNSIPILSAAIPDDVFKVADSQVASRWGNITEFKGFDLITPNEKEARFALADQDSNIGKLAAAVKWEAGAKNIILKLGERGVFFIENELPYSVDSFARCVKDAVGAGDALLAYATLTMLATKSLPMACIMGSLAAACECEIDGNIPIRPENILAKLDAIERMI